MSRKRATGGAPQTTLSADISASALVFTVPAGGGTGYPDGSNGQFIITFERTFSKEEKVLCDSRAGDTFTIAAGGRGYDDTTAQIHTTGATVNHTIGAVIQNELYDFLTLPDAAGEIPFATAADNWGKKGFGIDLIMSGTLAARPAFGTAGRLYFATDDAGGTLYRDSGAAWVKVGAADHGALSGLVDDDHTQYLDNTRHDVTIRHPTAVIANDAVTYPKMQNVSAASRLLGRGSAAGAGDPEEITLGTGLSMAGTALSASVGGLTKIAETITGSAVASVALSSIPATYRSLLLSWAARGDTVATGADLLLRFNGDTAANYNDQRIRGTSTSVAGTETLGGTSIRVGIIVADSGTANRAGVGRLLVPDYARTVWEKTLTSDSAVSRDNGTGNTETIMFTGHWRNTAAVTSITLLASAGNINTGSVFTLYGLST